MPVTEANGGAPDNDAIARRVGGQVFLMMAFALVLLLLVTFFLITHDYYISTIRNENLHRQVFSGDDPSLLEYFVQREGLVYRLQVMLAGGAVFCVLACWIGQRAGLAICESGRKSILAGAMLMILPAIGASVITYVIAKLLAGELNTALLIEPKDEIIYPILTILTGLLTMAMPMGMLAGYLTRVLGLRKIAKQLETKEILDRVH